MTPKRTTPKRLSSKRLAPGRLASSRHLGLLALLVVATMTTSPPVATGAQAVEAQAPPELFSVRLEGYTTRALAGAIATADDPRSSYSFATLVSTPGVGGDPNLSARSVGTTNHPGDLGGAALFTPDSPTQGTANFPLYSEAFFPAFESVNQSSYAEKCAFSVSNTESPECRDQPGPYALAWVVPDPAAPRAIGVGRDAGRDPGDEGQVETFSRSEVFTKDDGTIVGRQVNKGRDLAVPDTPITVKSFVTSAQVVATLEGVDAQASCTAEVTVAGETIDGNEELQAALAPFSAVSGVNVTYIPPTEAQVEETFGGTKAVSCTGAHLVVRQPTSAVAVEYVYGSTFATSSKPRNREPLGGSGLTDLGPVRVPPPPSPPAASPPSSAAGDAGRALVPPAAPDATRPEPPPPPEQPPGDEQAAPRLVPAQFDPWPIAAGTAAAAVLVPLGFWLLLGVTGSLARGYTSLRLPPFRD